MQPRRKRFQPQAFELERAFAHLRGLPLAYVLRRWHRLTPFQVESIRNNSQVQAVIAQWRIDAANLARYERLLTRGRPRREPLNLGEVPM